MASVINSKSTKADLTAVVLALEAELSTERRISQALHDELLMARSAPTLPQGRATHAAYYDYVAKQRLVARTAGLRVATYKCFADWAQLS